MKIILIFIIAVLLIERFDVLNKEPISGLINPITYLSCRDDRGPSEFQIFSIYSKHAYNRKNLYQGWDEYKNEFQLTHKDATFESRYITHEGMVLDKDKKILIIQKKYTYTCKDISKSQFQNKEFEW